MTASFAAARRLDGMLSNYRADSALSVLNQERSVRAQPELLRFARQARRWLTHTLQAEVDAGWLSEADAIALLLWVIETNGGVA